MLINKDSFTVDEIEHSGASDRLTIRAHSANFRVSLNVQREASWHNATLGDVVKTAYRRDTSTGVMAHWLNTRQAKSEALSVRRKRKKPSSNEEKQGNYLVGNEENVLVLHHTYTSKHNAERAARAN